MALQITPNLAGSPRLAGTVLNGGGSSVPSNALVDEDGTTPLVDEDGTTYLVNES